MLLRALPRLFLVVFVGLAALGVRAQAPLTIDNVADRATPSLQTWFRVPSASGYLYQVLLDDQPMPVDVTNWVTKVDYHEISVARTNLATGAVSNRLVRFILQSERGDPEKGLIEWTPYPPIPSTAGELAGAQMKVIVPQAYPADLPIPVIVWLENADGNARRANGYVTAPGFEANPVQIFRGVGSAMLPPAGVAGPLSYNATLPGLQSNKVIQVDNATTWTTRSGVLAASEVWPVNSRIHLNGNLTVPSGLSLTVGAGTIVKLNPLVNITNSGTVQIDGTVDQPVVFTSTNVVWPEVRAGAWGGFVMNAGTARLIASGAIFSGAGGAASWSWPSGGSSHKSEQPVLSLWNGAKAYFTNCAIIHTAGQVGNGYNSDLTLDHTLCQRAITAGEYVGGVITINHSAIIEFPNDDGVVDATIAEADYDAIYFTTGTHILQDSLFGFAKDDAIDSGSGGAGTVWVTNCWVESALHEAHAWSGSGRVATTYDTVLMNNGQGLEAGWTQTVPDGSPDVFAERLLTIANSVGARFGDNYTSIGSGFNGFLRLTNSLDLYNYRDVFLKTWNNPGSGWQTNFWVDRLQQIDIRSNYLTAADTRVPSNQVWNPTADGWRLAHWMTTPPGAPVGVGFAYRTNQLPMTNLLAGVPVRLSSFTTNFVTVDYAFENAAETLTTGSLTFSPGETLKIITPSGFNAQTQSLVRAVLRGAAGGELTGRTNIAFTGSLPAAQIGLAVTTNFLEGARQIEGTFARLTLPVTAPVSLGYTFSAGGQTLQEGTLVLDPLETQRQLFLTAVSPSAYPLVTLTVGTATNATLTGYSSISFTNPPLTIYLAVASNQLALAALSNGVPLGLTGGAPSGTRVDFHVEGNLGSSTNGTLEFAPGEISRLLLVPTLYGAGDDFFRVSFSNPIGVPWTGHDSVFYVRVVSAPTPPPQKLITRGTNSIWRYRDAASAAPANWATDSFDDSAWPAGPAQLGFSNNEENDEATLIADNNQITSYFRHRFPVSDPTAFTNLSMWLLRDDGGVVYLNGREVFRSPNLPQPPNVISYSTTTVGTNGENTIDTATLAASFLQPGTNLAAVEIHQQSATSSDVSFDFELIGNPAPPPPPPQTLYWGLLSGGMTLAWGDSSFVLEQSTNLMAGSWTLATNRSPWIVLPGQPQLFFRLRR